MPGRIVYVLLAKALWRDRYEILGGYSRRKDVESTVLAHHALGDMRRGDQLTMQVWRDGVLVETLEFPRLAPIGTLTDVDAAS